MEFTKILLLVAATLFTTEAHNVARRATFDLGQFVGSTDQAVAAAQTVIIAGAKELISVTDKAKTTLLGFIQTAKDTQTSVRAQAQTEIDSIVKNAAAKASTQTGDKACVTKIIADVEALGATTLLKVSDCLMAKVTALEDLLAKVVSTADTAITMAPAAIVGITDCQARGGFLEKVCEGLVAFKFVTQVNAVVGDVTSIVATATTLYSTLVADMSACAAGKVAELTPAATKLVAGYAVCEMKAKLLG